MARVLSSLSKRAFETVYNRGIAINRPTTTIVRTIGFHHALARSSSSNYSPVVGLSGSGASGNSILPPGVRSLSRKTYCGQKLSHICPSNKNFQFHTSSAMSARLCHTWIMESNEKIYKSKSIKNVALIVSPQSCLVDDNLDVAVKGLQPAFPYTVAAELNDSDVSAASYAHYTSDSEGIICLSKMASQGGSFVGVEPTGLLWAMDVVPGQKPGRRIMKKDVTKPFEVKFSVFPGHVDPIVPVNMPDEKQYKPIVESIQKRWYLADGVKRREVREGRVRGTFFIPPGKGPFIATIDMFGTAGGILEFRSALLASRGIASLALPYFHYEDLPTEIHRLDLEYFGEAVDWLYSQPEVFNKHGVGAIGVSYGANLAVAMAEYFPKVGAVVSINGGHANFVAKLYLDGKLTKELAMADWAACSFLKEKDDAIVFRNSVLSISNEDIEACSLKPEKSDADFLILAGGNDLMMDPETSKQLYNRMIQKGKTNAELLILENTGHLVEPPHTMLCFHSFHKVYGTYFAWGGEKVGHARGQELSWARIQEFLKSRLSKPIQSKI